MIIACFRLHVTEEQSFCTISIQSVNYFTSYSHRVFNTKQNFCIIRLGCKISESLGWDAEFLHHQAGMQNFCIILLLYVQQ